MVIADAVYPVPSETMVITSVAPTPKVPVVMLNDTDDITGAVVSRVLVTDCAVKSSRKFPFTSSIDPVFRV